MYYLEPDCISDSFVQGDLICCETCPATFHTCCAGLDSIPDEDWYCPACTKIMKELNEWKEKHPGNMNAKEMFNEKHGEQESCVWLSCEGYTQPSGIDKTIKLLNPDICSEIQVGNVEKSDMHDQRPAKRQKISAHVAKVIDARLDDVIKACRDSYIKKCDLNSEIKSNVYSKTNPINFNEETARNEELARSADIQTTNLWINDKDIKAMLNDMIRKIETLEDNSVPDLTHGYIHTSMHDMAPDSEDVLANISTLGAIEIYSLVDGTTISFELIHCAAAAKEKCFGFAPNYSKKQRKRLRTVLSAAYYILHVGYGGKISDSRTGADILPWMMRGRRLANGSVDFSNFYVGVLYANGTVVSAACLRKLDRGIAEIPVLATRPELRTNALAENLLGQIEGILLRDGTKRLYTPGYIDVGVPYTVSSMIQKVPGGFQNIFQANHNIHETEKAIVRNSNISDREKNKEAPNESNALRPTPNNFLLGKCETKKNIESIVPTENIIKPDIPKVVQARRWSYHLASEEDMKLAAKYRMLRFPGVMYAVKELTPDTMLSPRDIPPSLKWSSSCNIKSVLRKWKFVRAARKKRAYGVSGPAGTVRMIGIEQAYNFDKNLPFTTVSRKGGADFLNIMQDPCLGNDCTTSNTLASDTGYFHRSVGIIPSVANPENDRVQDLVISKSSGTFNRGSILLEQDTKIPAVRNGVPLESTVFNFRRQPALLMGNKYESMVETGTNSAHVSSMMSTASQDQIPPHLSFASKKFALRQVSLAKRLLAWRLEHKSSLFNN